MASQEPIRISTLLRNTQGSSAAATWTIPIVLAIGAVAYVYRFPFLVGNLSLFRLSGLLVAVVLFVRLLSVTRARASKMLQRMLVPTCLAIGITIVVVAEVAFRTVPEGYASDALVQTINVSIFLLMIAYMDTSDRLDRVIKAYVLVWYVEAFLAITAVVTGQLMLGELVAERGAQYYSELQLVNDSGGLRRLTGTFYDPNFYGAYLCTVIALATSLVIRGSASRLTTATIPLSAFLILLTASRTAMLGLCVLGVAVFVLLPRARKAVIGVALATAPVLIAYTYVFSEIPLLERILSGQSALDRLEFFARGVAAFAREPLLGSGTVALIDPETGFSTAHSVYLSILGKFGLLGASCFAAFIFGPIAIALYRRLPLRDHTVATLCVLPLAVMYLAYDFFQFLEFQFLVYAIAYAAVLPRARGERL